MNINSRRKDLLDFFPYIKDLLVYQFQLDMVSSIMKFEVKNIFFRGSYEQSVNFI